MQANIVNKGTFTHDSQNAIVPYNNIWNGIQGLVFIRRIYTWETNNDRQRLRQKLIHV